MTEISAQHFTGPPEYYSDAVRMNVSTFGFTFEFALQTDSPGDAKSQVTVRMSPQHTKVFYQILKNNLRAYEQAVGTINLPEALYTDMGIEREV